MEPTLVHDDASPRDYRDRPPRELPPLIGGVAHTVVKQGCRDVDAPAGIPEGEVRVRAQGDRALAGVEPVELRVVGGAEGDELVERQPARADPLGEEQGESELEP